MEPSFVGYLIYGTICGFGIKDFSDLLSMEKQSFAVKMSEMVCRHVNECPTHGSTKYLVVCGVNYSQEMTPITKDRIITDRTQKENTPCLKSARIVQTISYDLKCINVSTKGNLEETGRQSKLEEKSLRLLVIQTLRIRGLPLYFRQIFLTNNTVRKYRFVKAKLLTAIAYISKTRNILVSHKSPNGTDAYLADSAKKPKTLCHLAAISLTIDEETEVIFLAGYYSGIYRMTMNGHERVLVIRRTFVYSTISVDPKGQRLYACFENGLVSYSYDGKDKAVIVLEAGVYSLVLDLYNSVIYYSCEKSLWKTHMSGGSSTVFGQLKHYPKSLVLLEGSLYVSFKMDNIISVFDVETGQPSENLDTYYKSNSGLLLCAVH